MARNKLSVRALIVAAAVAVAGCGSSTHSSTTTQSSTTAPLPAPTKADWLAKARKLCDKYNAEIGAVGGGAHDPASRNAVSTAVINLIRQHVAEVRAIGYPVGDRATLEPIWNGMDQALDQLQRTGPHPNIEQDAFQALSPWVKRLQAYGSC